MTGNPISQHRTGRNWVHVGDPVKITPSRPGKKDGFETTVIAMRETGGGVEVDVKHPYNGAVRTFPFARVQRRATIRKETR